MKVAHNPCRLGGLKVGKLATHGSNSCGDNTYRFCDEAVFFKGKKK